ncbi:copper fist DNA binding domain protein [Aspergillus piperis CBS 112811]|uniref:Copper fist DNA binding domain protein n=1 Tax=Aspergillus piperis CBS 112811 TaxID=1448313 RepID=A0A8G1VM65_9EURO|nr:copper fist DNA binding domain protein [Aspergillus piperis CBS 112811]RAH57470.1 copper fist DNA binding domain protein [Aspergillus piperis CBS 112811]
MLIDGEKWACEACVRGHRVSSCHHSDRPLTHINKKGRPVSQCAHCRGLRKSRTTHTKCECGDKKKNCHKNDLDPHVTDKRDHKQDSRPKCGCTHGQRCTCALKKEPHLDTVPETGLPPPPAAALLDQPKKPQLTSTKSESTLTIFRDGHHKPAHKHNDMAHKCGLPYTIPRSHTIHAGDVARRSVDHLPLVQPTMLNEGFANQQQPAEQSPARGQHRRVKSEHGSPESAPVVSPDNVPTTVPPLDISSFFPQVQTAENAGDVGVPEPVSMPMKTPLDPLVTSGLPFDMSSFSSFPTTATSPVNCVAFQDPYKEPFFTSPEGDVSLQSTAFSAPPVDWSSFPLYSSEVPAATSTQAPSYASFDYNSMAPGFPAPSSSGDISEADEFAPIPGLGRTGSDLHDLNSVSEGSDIDHFRISSASSFIGLPQAQLLASNNLESIDIDDFLKSANESTAALEHQLQATMGMEAKQLPTEDAFAMSNAETFKPVTTPTASMSMTTPPTEAAWNVGLFDPNTAPMSENSNGNFYVPPWVQ